MKTSGARKNGLRVTGYGRVGQLCFSLGRPQLFSVKDSLSRSGCVLGRWPVSWNSWLIRLPSVESGCSAGRGLSSQLFDLAGQGFVLGKFAFEKAAGDASLLGDAGRGKLVQVSVFLAALVEIGHFEQAFVHQRLNAVVHFAQAEAQFLGQRALADIGLRLQCPKQAKSGFQVHFLGGEKAGSGRRRQVLCVQARYRPWVRSHGADGLNCWVRVAPKRSILNSFGGKWPVWCWLTGGFLPALTRLHSMVWQGVVNRLFRESGFWTVWSGGVRWLMGWWGSWGLVPAM